MVPPEGFMEVERITTLIPRHPDFPHKHLKYLVLYDDLNNGFLIALFNIPYTHKSQMITLHMEPASLSILFFYLIFCISIVLILASKLPRRPFWRVGISFFLFPKRTTPVTNLSRYRSSRPEVFCEKGVLGNFAKFTARVSGTGVFL